MMMPRPRQLVALLLLLLFASLPAIAAVKRGDFKTCSQAGFCRRLSGFRNLVDGDYLPPPKDTANADAADAESGRPPSSPSFSASSSRAAAAAAYVDLPPLPLDDKPENSLPIANPPVGSVQSAPPVGAKTTATGASSASRSRRHVGRVYCMPLRLPDLTTLPGADAEARSDLLLCLSVTWAGAVHLRIHPARPTNDSFSNPAHVALDPLTAGLPARPLSVIVLPAPTATATATNTNTNTNTFANEHNIPASSSAVVEIVADGFPELLVRVFCNPLRIDVLRNGKIGLSFNAAGLLRLEFGGNKTDSEALLGALTAASNFTAADFLKNSMDGAFDESFNGHADPKPHGPRAFSIDVSFPAANSVYGLAEHATRLNLPFTRGPNAAFSSPYRLLNLDVFEYETNSEMALYGHVPLLNAIVPGVGAAAVFVLNAAEMWVDIEKNKKLDDSVLSHWMVETGPLELYFFVEDNPADLLASYLKLTGSPILPSISSIGYHQCRWNYESVADVLEVDNSFDIYQIPYDYIWLDIEHTDNKKYFTWNPHFFSNPEKITSTLKLKKRYLVTITDPHIKVEPNYNVYETLINSKNFVAGPNELLQPFEGNCWPGNSIWFDFLLPDARNMWSSFYNLDFYKGTAPNLYTWIDMNEPSVFSGPEITLPKNAHHMHGKYENREVHNIYGMLMHEATYNGLLLRDKKNPINKNNKSGATPVRQSLGKSTLRPFVLSRAFFAGSQRFGAIWTGDNYANWDHLRMTTPMILSLSTCGISFTGADVGGFFKNPSAELMVRWYQVATLQPFFRSHAHIESARREPWVFNDHVDIIREIILIRYKLLPTMYTAFAAASEFRETVAAPLFMEHTEDPESHSIDDQFMLGTSGIMVAPVVHENQKARSVYLPRKRNQSGGRSNSNSNSNALPPLVWYQIGMSVRNSLNFGAPPPKISNVRRLQKNRNKDKDQFSADSERDFTVAKVHAVGGEGGGGRHVEVEAPLWVLPLFFRGGSIIFYKPSPRQSAEVSHLDDMSMIVVLDAEYKASGRLYLDDGISHAYKKGGGNGQEITRIWMSLTFDGTLLKGQQTTTTAAANSEQNYEAAAAAAAAANGDESNNDAANAEGGSSTTRSSARNFKHVVVSSAIFIFPEGRKDSERVKSVQQQAAAAAADAAGGHTFSNDDSQLKSKMRKCRHEIRESDGSLLVKGLDFGFHNTQSSSSSWLLEISRD